jgi:DNA-binding transcriptional LysR family regulator
MQNRRIIDASFAQAGIRPKTTIESNSTIALVANVAEGGWMTILPEDMAQFLIRGKPMRSLPLVGQSTKHLVGLVAPYREPHTPVLAALLRAAGKLAQIY